jgi:hypothetical protein
MVLASSVFKVQAIKYKRGKIITSIRTFTYLLYNIKYVGVLISLWLFLLHLRVVCSTTKIIFVGLVKEVRTTKS